MILAERRIRMNQFSQILLYLESLSDKELQQLMEKNLKVKNAISPIESRACIIETTLMKLHHNPTNLGFNYLKQALHLCLEKPEMLKSITKILYPTIAQQEKSTASRVERAIRHSIEISWNHISIEQKQEVFFNQKEKPNNSLYIAYVCKYIENIEKQQDYPTQKVLR